MEKLKTIIKKMVATLTAFIIIMTQYVITGLIETSYAIDLLATQSDNVQFRAYFMNGEEELTEIESSINAKDLKLKIDVAVKNEGYFNGQISFENTGFKLKQATNSYINKIENNMIYLKQLNAEETASIEVGIEYINDEVIAISTLNDFSTVKLTGTYTGSAGNITIDSGSQVKVNWKVPENTKAEVEAKIQTNSIYEVGDESKKIVQYLISSKLKDNAYPIKTTEIMATIPEGATKTEVHKRTTSATNGDQEFTEINNVRKEGNNIIITVNNNEVDGKISWKKDTQDVYVVTYEYPENVDLSAQNIIINGKITTQNNVELSADQVQLALNKNLDGITSINKQEKETSIYKGKIYSGEPREFTSYTKAYVDYFEGIKSIEITEDEVKYAKKIEENGDVEEKIDANVEIKKLIINKEKIATVLGTTWNMTIGETTITNEKEADENGNVTIPLPEGTKTFTIRTSKPVNNGSFIIETVKEIKNTEHTREEKKELTYLIDSSLIKGIKNDDYTFQSKNTFFIRLKDTESKASIQCSENSLIESDEVQPLDLTVTLESNGENQDLYKNPELRIELPKQITSASFTKKPQLMYANGLKLNDENYKIEEKDGKKVINIKLTGEQASYLGETVKGATILIETKVSVAQNINDTKEEIVLTYTNENATIYSDNGRQVTNIDFIANNTQNTPSSNENQNPSGENSNPSSNNPSNNTEGTTNENKKISLDFTGMIGDEKIENGSRVKTGEIITYTVTMKNNEDKDAEDLKLTIAIPDYVTFIDVNPKFPGYDEEIEEYTNTEPYFTKKTEKTISKENISIKSGETKNIQFMVRVNEYIDNNTDGVISATIEKNGEIIESNIISHRFTQGDLVLSLEPEDREPNINLIYGYKAIYGLNITNISDETLNNIRIKINKNDALEVFKLQSRTDNEYTNLDKDNLDFSIGSIEAGEHKRIVISTTINNDNNLNIATISGIVSDSSGNIYRSNKLSDKVLRKKVEIEQSTNIEQSEQLKSKQDITYTYTIKNIGDLDLESMLLEDKISDYIDIISVKLDGKNIEYTTKDVIGENYYYIDMSSKIKTGKSCTLEIKGKLKDISDVKEETKVVNQLLVYEYTELMKNSSEISHTISENNKSGNNNTTPEKTNDEQNENNEKEENSKDTYSISGIAWYDENENGQREKDELLLSNINVSAINIKENAVVKQTKTNNIGEYSISELNNGNYILLFDYNNEKYFLTQYKKEGVNNSVNSDAKIVNMNIDGTSKNVASTDTIEIDKENISNIDIGLINAKKFDLKLTKTISQITISNSQGVTKKEFNNETLAKTEIKAKYLRESIAVIEYKIRVTNEGQVSGYAQEIVDYKPTGLEFNSSLNKDWYKEGENLYSKSLANKKIEPGETVELTLILTKKMTESNTGLINNKAEISKSYNTLGIEDIDSKTGNKKADEDDLGSADVIISVSTGTLVNYLVVTTLILIIIGIGTFIISKKIIEKSIEN